MNLNLLFFPDSFKQIIHPLITYYFEKTEKNIQKPRTKDVDQRNSSTSVVFFFHARLIGLDVTLLFSKIKQFYSGSCLF